MNRNEKIVNDIMTFQEVMEYLQVSRCTLDKIIKSGKIRVFRVSRQLRFRKNDVDEYIKNSYLVTEAQNEKKEDNRQHCTAQKQ